MSILSLPYKESDIYTTINFTMLSVSDGSGRLICAPYLRLAGLGLGVVKCAWLAGRGGCTESRPELETVNK